MSWHCAICGNSEHVTGLLEIYDIRGCIPIRVCVHISCLSACFPASDYLLNQLKELDEENNLIEQNNLKRTDNA